MKKYVLLVLLICIPAVMSLVRSGYFPMFDDMQVIRLDQMDKCIKDSQIPCRWVPDLGYGFGYPLFQYYAPLPYYTMEIFHFFGLSLIDSVKVGFGLSVILSGLFFFLWVRKFISSTASIVATTLYIYVPLRAADLYVRGGMGQLWGMVGLPLILWGYENLRSKNSKKSLFVFSLCVGLFLISHNLTVLMGSLIIIPWFVLRTITVPEKSTLTLKTFLGLVLGFGLSAFFTIPLILEKDLVHIETLIQGYFNYLAHFASLKQLFFSMHWGYGPSELGPNDDVFIGVGPLHFLVGIIGLTFAFIKNKGKKTISILLFLVFLASAFLVHQRSSYIWENLTVISILQFPWRFLVISVLCLSVLGGMLIESVPNKFKNLSAVILIAVTVGLNGNFFKPKDWFPLTDKEKLSGAMLERQQTASIYDYLPKSASTAPKSVAPNSLIIEPDSGVVLESYRGTNWFKYLVNAEEETNITIPTFDFPVWKVSIDGQPVEHKPTGELGLLTLSIPKGKHTVEARLNKSSPRKYGDYITIGSLAVLFIGLIKSRRNEK